MDLKSLFARKLYRRGAIFTVLSVLISSIVLIVFFSSMEPPADADVDKVRLRVSLTNHHVFQADNYVVNALVSSSRAAFVNLTDHMISTDSFLGDFNAEFRSCVLSGEFNGGSCEDADINSRLQGIESFMLDELDVEFNITVNNVSISQSDSTGPWHIRLEAEFSLGVDDRYAEWNSERSVRYNFPIYGLRDPNYEVDVYPVVAGDISPNNISVNESLTRFVQGPPATLNRLTEQRHYFAFNGAPSFLDRLNNNMGAERSYGITSLVSPDDIGSVSDDLSHLDFILWRGNDCHLGPYARIYFDDPHENEKIHEAVVPESLLDVVNITSDAIQEGFSCP